MKEPNEFHPITLEPAGSEVTVTFGDRQIARSTGALRMQEADYPPVLYIPRADVDMSCLSRSDHKTYCPYKGDASYFHISAGGRSESNKVWSYEGPYPAVAAIIDHLAFYPDAVEILEQPKP